MPYKLSEAAKATGVNRTTLLRAVRDGRLSATRDEASGAWLIEPAELHRLYPPRTPTHNVIAQERTPADNSPDANTLRVRLDAAERIAQVQADTIADLRRRLDAAEAKRTEADAERRQATERLQALLTDQRISPAPVRRIWRFWRR